MTDNAKIVKEKDLKYVAQISKTPKDVIADWGKGCTLKTVDGKEYLDFMAGVAVTATGHSHPKVVEAIHKQAQRVIHANCFGNYTYGIQAELAELLAERAPGDLQSTFFSNSGAEAVEGAIKLAVKATGRKKLIYFQRAFHGRTYMTLSVSSKRLYKDPFEPLYPWAIEVPYNDIHTVRGVINDDVAAIIVEPIQGEGGIRLAQPGFLAALKETAQKYGSVLIVDEIQAGMGRTGKWFACQHDGVVPDIMTMAKGLASGMPLGGFIASKELMSVFMEPTLIHCSTFAGNPVCCAAAVATIQVIEEEGLLDNARQRGAELMDGMNELKSAYPEMIKDVRGRGLLIAMELTTPQRAAAFVMKAKELGVTVSWTMNAGANVRISPPLVITAEQVGKGLDIFNSVFKKIK
jgi:acetylornithine/succinyldiaminopimelate/putrescine aminotransferase